MNKAEQSKERISQALLRLLKKHEYQKITIQDIVDEAQVSRMAFYRNYENKDQIMKDYLDKVTDDFIRNTQIDYGKNDLGEYFDILIGHLVEHQEIGLTLVKAGLYDYMRAEFDRAYVARAKSKQETFNYYFLSGGVCNVYYYWLASGCKESAEELTKILNQTLKQKI